MCSCTGNSLILQLNLQCPWSPVRNPCTVPTTDNFPGRMYEDGTLRRLFFGGRNREASGPDLPYMTAFKLRKAGVPCETEFVREPEQKKFFLSHFGESSVTEEKRPSRHWTTIDVSWPHVRACTERHFAMYRVKAAGAAVGGCQCLRGPSRESSAQQGAGAGSRRDATD